MTEKMLARVAVSSVPYAADRLYTYLVPDELIGSAEARKWHWPRRSPRRASDAGT